MEGTNMTAEEYAQHWENSDHWGDSGLSWGDITRGVDLIDQVGSFDNIFLIVAVTPDLAPVTLNPTN